MGSGERLTPKPDPDSLDICSRLHWLWWQELHWHSGRMDHQDMWRNLCLDRLKPRLLEPIAAHLCYVLLKIQLQQLLCCSLLFHKGLRTIQFFLHFCDLWIKQLNGWWSVPYDKVEGIILDFSDKHLGAWWPWTFAIKGGGRGEKKETIWKYARYLQLLLSAVAWPQAMVSDFKWVEIWPALTWSATEETKPSVVRNSWSSVVFHKVRFSRVCGADWYC